MTFSIKQPLTKGLNETKTNLSMFLIFDISILAFKKKKKEKEKNLKGIWLFSTKLNNFQKKKIFESRFSIFETKLERFPPYSPYFYLDWKTYLSSKTVSVS